MSAFIVIVIFLAILGIIGLFSMLGGFAFLLQLFVVAKEAGKRPHQDQGVYTLDQGREVKAEEQD
ncbi:MAG: hypothetical protein GFH27_549279n142 [Chloroflexi bacterium AL-W]|nr:hypothetical protein [Chloroflexi bacterium AL-N1]NOK65108.1 hypothetical protein [Chloroflexi bacterium AL-N10]NOK72625.1 hypothetical protein [Chloroflexi bacterium AL-N5]NOK79287.1 hypothetical protein [Chloroflexi bacterium AL-W]NOK87203.1 hypothetical protein [Chloroflexi bacterium AL-N15]